MSEFCFLLCQWLLFSTGWDSLLLTVWPTLLLEGMVQCLALDCPQWNGFLYLRWEISQALQINQNNYNTKRGFFVIPFTAKIQIWILFTVCHFFIIWPWEFGIKLNNIHKLMLFCILDTFLKDNVLILEGEITNWSLLGVKELENAAKMIVGSSCLICVYNTFVV